MLNLKKGLALMLAAATALTFTPVANLGAPVQAEAAAADQKVTLAFTDTSAEAKSFIDVNIGSARTLKLSLGDPTKVGLDTENVTFDNTKSSVASVDATTNGSTTVTDGGAQVKDFTSNATVKVKGNQIGTSTLTVNYGKQSKSYTIRVLDSSVTTSVAAKVSNISVASNRNTSTKAVKAGTVELSGTNYSDNLSTNKPSAPATAAITDKTGVASNKIRVQFDSDPIVSADGKTAAFGVKVYNNGASVGDTFKVDLAQTVESQSLTGSFNVTIVNPAEREFTYGGVLERIYAYKGASYDLAEHASISYTPEGNTDRSSSTPITLNPNEIKWYLVDGAAAPTEGVARDTIKSLNIPSTAGTVTNGDNGSLKVTVTDPTTFKTAVTGAKIVGEAYIAGVRTIVYVGSAISVDVINGNVKNINAGISVSKQGRGFSTPDDKIGVLDDQIANPDHDNIYLKGSEISYPVDSAVVGSSLAETNNKYALHVVQGGANDNPFKGSYLSINSMYDQDHKLPTGNYYETAYIPFQITTNGTSTTYILKVDITVSVNTGVQFRVKDGSSILATTYDEKLATDPTVYLNLADKKTFDIFEHIESDVDKTKVSFSYDKDSANVDVDSKGVITPKSVGNAVVTIKASYNGIESSTTLRVRVSQYGFDTVTVKGQDGETARVLSVRDYDNNNEKDITEAAGNDGEYQLVTRQIPYVEIHITGSESSNVVESPVATSANGAALSYSFDDDVKTMSAKGLTIDPSTGKITLDYNKCKSGVVLGVYAVKVVSAATSKSEATTSYYYVVVDYPDQPIKGLEDNYTVGTCNDNSRYHTDDPAVELYEESGKTAKDFTEVNKKTDDFNGASLYADDNTDAFDVTAIGQTGRDESISSPTANHEKASIDRATADKQTMHVVAFNAQDKTKKIGGTYKLITVTSAPAVENKVVKITNRDTGAVIYDDAKDSKKTAVRLSINDITHIQITLAYPVTASGSAIGVSLNAHKTDAGSVVNQPYYVTAVLNSNNIDATLYPNFKGTQVIGVTPTGHLTATDRRDIHKKEVLLAVEYDGSNANTAKPAKITGVKVGNKKGAKVVVKFTKSSLDKNGLSMKYYVQKKVGKKTSGKSIGSARTTLSVKKGATVKVRVKAYYYDTNGNKHVGAWSKWVTKKTDKK